MNILMYEGNWIDSMPEFSGYFQFETKMFNNFELYQVFNENFNIIFNKNNMYYGEMDQKGRFSDKGIYVEKNGHIFKGQFLEGKWLQGQLVLPNKNIYTGQFFEYRYFGKGTLEKSNGDIYKGFFEKGKYNGEGMQILRNGDVYNGMFKQGLRHGPGVEEFSNGEVLKGNYDEGVRNGKFYLKTTNELSENTFYKYKYNKGTVLKTRKIKQKVFDKR